MKLRHAVLAIVIAAVSGAAWFGWRAARAPSTHAGPVILISIDTLRADRLPIYGYRNVATLDQVVSIDSATPEAAEARALLLQARK